MPSGAKKRKAAKKKKGNQSISTQSHGGDLKQQHQSNLKDGEKEETYREESIVVEKGGVIKVKGEFSEKDGKIEHDLSGSSRSNSSSSSSSDDESNDVKNSQAVDYVKAEVNLNSQCGNSTGSNEIKSVSSENAEKPPSYEEKIGTSGSEIKEVVTVIQSDKDATAILDQKKCVLPEIDDTLTLSYDAPKATVDNGAEHEKDSGVTQPLLAPDQQPKQTTSWKSCCGLFEVFTGSGR